MLNAWHRLLHTFGGETEFETAGGITFSVWSAEPPA